MAFVLRCAFKPLIHYYLLLSVLTTPLPSATYIHTYIHCMHTCARPCVRTYVRTYILLRFLCVKHNLKTTFICRHICILFISYNVTVVSIHHIKYQCPVLQVLHKGGPGAVGWYWHQVPVYYRALHGPHSI